MGIFSKIQDYVGQQKSNVFDLSFVNNLTLPIGALVPCCVKEVVNGDKFRIRGRFGFNFLPTYFPIQSTLKVDCQFFYVRNRNLFNRWEDFQFNPDISSDEGLTLPYISGTRIRSSLEPGSIYDYMGIPVTFPSDFINSNTLESERSLTASQKGNYYSFPEVGSSSTNNFVYHSDVSAVDPSWKYGCLLACTSFPKTSYTFLPSITQYFSKNRVDIYFSATTTTTPPYSFKFYYYSDGVLKTESFTNPYDPDVPVTLYVDNVHSNGLGNVQMNSVSPFVSYVLIEYPSGSDSQIPLPFSVVVSPMESSVTSQSIPASNLVNPLYNTSDGGRINSLSFRAYESIYNSFYRDERVNPLLSDGKPVYNKWLLNTDGGSDLNSYSLHYRNWELDPYTSAQLSPQQGVAPLVGVTSLGDMQFASSDGQTYTVRPNLADDGTTVVNADLSSDIPSDVRRSFINLATSGISINDFRNVNSFQRWLETNMRRGYKYRDQIIAHTGVRPRFDVLDMPEFIGGFSTVVNSQKVNQTSESTPDNPLGSYAGQMSAFANSQHDINITCDENGFIIGIVCVYPVPVYDSLLAPHFSYTQPLDYYNNEFSHIGMQPIYNYMVAPNLALGDSTSEIWAQNSKVFGYQRAWWQYLSSTDEVHGEFHTSFKDFLFRRDFGNQPSLSPSFTVINPDEITNPFSVRTTKDKVLGQIAFDIKAIRPIPKFGIPRIE